ncbi:hypothetical protein ACW5XW_01525 [Aeromonas piscicola]|uniref:hypothetical protein n=1 Tax=Aeromonas piscicola TaxID=600645 RepID=UPI0005B461EA|nr:hypothetical protein [Aeromonas piscicola]
MKKTSFALALMLGTSSFAMAATTTDVVKAHEDAAKMHQTAAKHHKKAAELHHAGKTEDAQKAAIEAKKASEAAHQKTLDSTKLK